METKYKVGDWVFVIVKKHFIIYLPIKEVYVSGIPENFGPFYNFHNFGLFTKEYQYFEHLSNKEEDIYSTFEEAKAELDKLLK